MDDLNLQTIKESDEDDNNNQAMNFWSVDFIAMPSRLIAHVKYGPRRPVRNRGTVLGGWVSELLFLAPPSSTPRHPFTNNTCAIQNSKTLSPLPVAPMIVSTILYEPGWMSPHSTRVGIRYQQPLKTPAQLPRLDDYVHSEDDIARCSLTLLQSSLYDKHTDYVRRQLLHCLLQVLLRSLWSGPTVLYWLYLS